MPHLRGEQGAASQATLSEERKAEVLRAYQERSSLQGLSRTFGITRKTITQWLKKLLSLPTVKETLFAAKASAVLELDEAWSFVWRRKNKRWLWTVMCQDPADRGLGQRRPQRGHLPGTLGAGAGSLPPVPQLQ